MRILSQFKRICAFSVLLLISIQSFGAIYGYLPDAGPTLSEQDEFDVVVKATPTPKPAATPVPGKVMQWGGDQSTLNRKTHIVQLIGNAYVLRDEEVLHADRIDLNTETHFVHAEGRVQYRYSEYLIRADAIDVDMKSKTGSIYSGNISNGTFALRGSKIDQVEPQHFLVNDYDYSTCYDCPNAWELTGKHADVTIGDYVFIKDFILKVKDASLMWLPYMVVPIKTKRQTGLLFPHFGSSDAYGFFFVEPFFWAINDFSDMTISAGRYSAKGARFEWQGRYALTEGSFGVMNGYWTRDSEVDGLSYRYALKGNFSQELPFGIDAKLNLNEVSDSGYPIVFYDDISGRTLPVLTSDLFFSRNDPSLSTVVSVKRIRNLLVFAPKNSKPSDYSGTYPVTGFDGNTVQEVPKVVVTTNDQFIFGKKVAFGVETRFNRFTRAVGPVDIFPATTDTDTGVVTPPHEVIREADRLTLVPSVYTTLNPWPWMSLVPSLQYRSYFYNFHDVPNYPSLERGYLLAQANMSFQLQKFYKTSDPNVSYKHTIRPSFTYSNIPIVQQPFGHPFMDQVSGLARPGQYFDSYDIVPYKTTQNLDSYFVPLGNSLTYGFVTQLFRRVKSSDDSIRVSNRLEAGMNQTLDIYQAKKLITENQKDDRIVLSPLVSHFLFNDGKFTGSFEYTYYSFLDRYDQKAAALVRDPIPHRFTSTISWTFESATRQQVLSFNRSINLSYSFAKLTQRISSLQLGSTFSINDYIQPRGSVSYSFIKGDSPKQLGSQGSVLFQSPSRCWQIELGVSHSIDLGSAFIFNYAFNITGSSFLGLEQQEEMLKKN